MRARHIAVLAVAWTTASACDLALGIGDYGPQVGAGGQGGELTTTTTSGGGAGGEGGVPTPYDQVVLADEPVAYWRLDDVEGDPRVALDLSDNHNDGTYLGAILLQQGSLIAGEDAAIALSGGAGDYVEIGDVLDFAVDAPFTVEAWVRPTDSDAGEIVAKFETSGWRLLLSGTNTQFRRELEGMPPQFALGERIPTGVASHVVGRFDGAEVCLFIDGVEIDCRASGLALPDEATGLRLGQALTGALDEVAIYEKALDDVRVAAHYEAGKP